MEEKLENRHKDLKDHMSVQIKKNCDFLAKRLFKDIGEMINDRFSQAQKQYDSPIAKRRKMEHSESISDKKGRYTEPTSAETAHT